MSVYHWRLFGKSFTVMEKVMVRARKASGWARLALVSEGVMG
jgi:hypothetical protein